MHSMPFRCGLRCRSVLTFMLAAVALSTGLSAYAESITETFTIDPTQIYTGGHYAVASTSSFSLFDANQGTLTGVTLSIMGTAAFTDTNPSAMLSFSEVDFSNDDFLTNDTQASKLPNGEVGFSSSGVVYSGSLADFIGSPQASGTLALQFLFSPYSTNDQTSISFPNSDTENFSLTYTYTPAATAPSAVTPEPSSLTLLGIGALGVAGVFRHRLEL